MTIPTRTTLDDVVEVINTHLAAGGWFPHDDRLMWTSPAVWPPAPRWQVIVDESEACLYVRRGTYTVWYVAPQDLHPGTVLDELERAGVTVGGAR